MRHETLFKSFNNKITTLALEAFKINVYAWQAQPIGFAPTDNTGLALHRASFAKSKLPGGASCRDYCSKDVNLQAYGEFSTRDFCFCYTFNFDIPMYSSFRKYPGSKKPIHAWDYAEPGFNGYQLFNGGGWISPTSVVSATCTKDNKYGSEPRRVPMNHA